MFHTATDAEASEDEASRERLPSEPEDAAAAAVQDPIRYISETPANIEQDLSVMADLAKIDPVEKEKQGATFSFNVVDLTAVKFKNPYNPRPIDKTEVRNLRNSLMSQGFRVFSGKNRIKVVIDPSLVEPSCITLDSAAPPKPLRLKPSANLTELTIIGGQHRQQVVILIKLEYEEKIRQLQLAIDSKNKVLSKFVTQPPMAEEETQKKSDLEEDIEALKLELSQYKKSMEVVGPWGVTLLDSGALSLVLWAYWRLLSPSQDERGKLHQPCPKQERNCLHRT